MVPLIALALAQPVDPEFIDLADRVSRSTVAVRAMAPLGERSGTGIVLTADGLILTSYAVIPHRSTDIRVWFRGYRVLPAEFVAASRADELTVIRVRAPEPLIPLPAGDSDAVRIGDFVATVGNPDNTLISDDQPSFSPGVVSGIYRLTEERAGASYLGPVLETTAAVHQGLDGAPLVNARGEWIGMITLNYSIFRWQGNAIPGAWIRHTLDEIQRTAVPPDTPPTDGRGTLGLRVEDSRAGVRVAEVVTGGPAEASGLRVGDVVLARGTRTIASAAEWDAFAAGLEVGDVVRLRVRTSMGETEVRLEVAAEP